MKKTNPHLKQVLLEIVDNQLREGKPPETSATFLRLQSEGYTPEEAKELIACVVTSEVFDIMKHNQPFDEARYVAALRALPRPPWD